MCQQVPNCCLASAAGAEERTLHVQVQLHRYASNVFLRLRYSAARSEVLLNLPSNHVDTHEGPALGPSLGEQRHESRRGQALQVRQEQVPQALLSMFRPGRHVRRRVRVRRLPQREGLGGGRRRGRNVAQDVQVCGGNYRSEEAKGAGCGQAEERGRVQVQEQQVSDCASSSFSPTHRL